MKTLQGPPFLGGPPCPNGYECHPDDCRCKRAAEFLARHRAEPQVLLVMGPVTAGGSVLDDEPKIRISTLRAHLDACLAEQEKLREESMCNNNWFLRHTHGIVVLRELREWLDEQAKR